MDGTIAELDVGSDQPYDLYGLSNAKIPSVSSQVKQPLTRTRGAVSVWGAKTLSVSGSLRR